MRTILTGAPRVPIAGLLAGTMLTTGRMPDIPHVAMKSVAEAVSAMFGQVKVPRRGRSVTGEVFKVQGAAGPVEVAHKRIAESARTLRAFCGINISVNNLLIGAGVLRGRDLPLAAAA